MNEKKHKPPSRIRYEKNNPVLSVRMPKEWIDKLNELLEQKMVSLLFFKIGVEYRLEIYDQLKVMLHTIKYL